MTRHDRALARVAAALLSLTVALPIVAPVVAAASPISFTSLADALDLSATDGTSLTDGTTPTDPSLTDGSVSATDGSGSLTDGSSVTDGTTPTDPSLTDGTVSATDGSTSATDGTDATAGILGVMSTGTTVVRRTPFSAWRTYRSRTAWIRGYWRALRDGRTVRGRASWYPTTRTWRGVPAVAMPGGRYRPRGTQTPFVRVCTRTRCATVPVVDYCQCYVNTYRSRVADLTLPLVRKLRLRPSDGIYTITIKLLPARAL